MKYLILGFFISFSVKATTLGQFISSPDGSSLQEFHISNKKIIYDKQSNFFDKNGDYSLGKFSTGHKLSKEESRKLNAILTKIKDVDTFLKKKKSSFNDLSMKVPHASFLILDGYRVAQESDLYSDLKKIYDDLMDQKWTQVSGIRMSPDYKKVIHIKNGKVTSEEEFNFAFHCKKSEPPSQCMFKDLGTLFLK